MKPDLKGDSVNPAMPRWSLACLACLLTACAAVAPEKPPVPDGSSRVPVNRFVRSGEMDGTAARKAALARPAFTLDARRTDGKTVLVSLLATLEKITRHTGLRLHDSDLADEAVPVAPSDDPFDVLRQLAGQTRYRISLDRATGYLTLSDEAPAAGVVVLRDTQPVQQIGAPVAVTKMPERPLPMIEALRLLAPADFDVGHADAIDPNIRVDLSQATGWLDGLERVAMQTPYRVVFDWDRRIIYAMPVASKLKRS